MNVSDLFEKLIMYFKGSLSWLIAKHFAVQKLSPKSFGQLSHDSRSCINRLRSPPERPGTQTSIP